MTRRTQRVVAEPILFGGLLALTAVLYLVNLSASGWANAFYSAAVQAGSQNWEAFLFGSSDAANSITVDKPPMSLWFMELSVRAFGLSSFSILLPEALMGVATVAVLYLIVRRRFPASIALLAGFTLAVTPVAALMFRFNNPDALLALLLTLAVYFTLRGVESGRIRWVIWAGVMVGLGFLTKQLQAFLVLPVLAGVYLYAAPMPLRKRIGHALAALGAVVVSAGWWVALVQLVPASARPYVGGSQTNSFLELTFGYNGLGRITGNETGSVTSNGPHWGGTGLDRLFSGDLGAQATWLMFATIAMIGLSLWFMRRLPRTSPTRATVLLLGGTMVLTALAFSFMGGIFHSYYMIALTPGLAGAFAIGTGMLWVRRDRVWVRIVIAVFIAGTAAWGWELLWRSGDWMPWLRWVVVGLGAAGAVGILLPLARGPRVGRFAVASLGLTAVLLGPVAFTLATISLAHTGAIVSAGPHGSGSAPVLSRPVVSASSVNTVLLKPASSGGLLDAPDVSGQFADYLATGATGYRWLAATIGSNMAAGYQLQTGEPVMAVGGFNGSDPSPTLAQFQQYVKQGEIRWFIGGTLGTSNGGSRESSKIAAWVAIHFEATTMGGARIYDLTKPIKVVVAP